LRRRAHWLPSSPSSWPMAYALAPCGAPIR
jgi:hypothetical protein